MNYIERDKESEFINTFAILLAVVFVFFMFATIGKMRTGQLLVIVLSLVVSALSGLKYSFPVLLFFAFFRTSGSVFGFGGGLTGGLTMGTVIIWGMISGLYFRKVITGAPIIKEKISLGEKKASDVIANLIEIFSGETLDTQDGLKITRDYGWVHLRPSNTEPILRCYAEAKTDEQARELADMVLNQI